MDVHIPITNPADKILQMSVVLENQSLSGLKAFTLKPKETFLYQVRISPAAVGTSDGRLVAEFGYLWF